MELQNVPAFHPEDSSSDDEVEQQDDEEMVMSSGLGKRKVHKSENDYYSNDVELGSSNAAATELYWSNICFSIGKGKTKKALLKGISGKAQGELMAIMGGSGAGKTTLLNSLAQRAGKTSNTKITGELLLNGSKYNKATLKRCAAYVMQDDLFMGEFTVRETLEFQAKLRLPHASAEERKQRIEEVVDLLGMAHTQNTLIGDPMKKGISGGERKRLAIACEILNYPNVLFLDEPTSGLDSTTSLSLVKILKSLTINHAITVICTIHQPSATVFFEFDKLLLLHHGETVYYGPTKGMVRHYTDNGFPVPKYVNPADHMLDVITVDSSSKDEAAKAAVRNNAVFLKDLYRSKHSQPISPVPPTKLTLKRKAPWLYQFWVVGIRCLQLSMRQPLVFIALLVQAILMGEFIGWVWRDLKNDSAEINRKLPLLFFVVINQGIYGLFIMINLFPAERAVVMRERSAGMYSASSYFLAKSLAELPIQLLAPLINVVQVYFLTGLRREAGHFFIFLGFAELASLCALSLSMAISAWSRTATVAATIVPLFVESFRLFGSFFTPPPVIPSYYIWIDAISFVSYAFRGVAQNELDGLPIKCLAVPPATCQYSNGTEMLDALELNKVPIYGCALVLIGLIVACRLIAYLGIRFFKRFL